MYSLVGQSIMTGAMPLVKSIYAAMRFKERMGQILSYVGPPLKLLTAPIRAVARSSFIRSIAKGIFWATAVYFLIMTIWHAMPESAKDFITRNVNKAKNGVQEPFERAFKWIGKYIDKARNSVLYTECIEAGDGKVTMVVFLEQLYKRIVSASKRNINVVVDDFKEVVDEIWHETLAGGSETSLIEKEVIGKVKGKDYTDAHDAAMRLFDEADANESEYINDLRKEAANEIIRLGG